MAFEASTRSSATSSYPGAALPPRHRLLGHLLLEEGLVTPAQLREALRAQKELRPRRPLGRILVSQKILTEENLDSVLVKCTRRPPLDDAVVESDLPGEDAREVERRRRGERDRGLARVINRAYARKHGVVPIAQADGRLTLAMANPTDVAVIEELRWSIGCRIEIVGTSETAFERAFQRVYGDSVATELLPGQTEPPRATDGSSGEREADTRALMELRAAYEELCRVHEVNASALRELVARHEAMVRDRERVAEVLEGVLRRLRPLPALGSSGYCGSVSIRSSWMVSK